MTEPSSFKNILCIRADNMGDLIMSSPAIRALKETYNCKITVLTSSASKAIARYIREIDEVIVYDLPWIKTDKEVSRESFFEVVDELKERRFDAAFIFTVYSQNPLPAAMLAYLAGIPRRVAYCRENPYDLLTDWLPDEEPYTFIRHQVRRDLDLVAKVGAYTENEKLSLDINEDNWDALKSKLSEFGFNDNKPWLILHPGVSEEKRQYPKHLWVEAAKVLRNEFQLLFTGGPTESNLTDELSQAAGEGAFSLGGKLSLDEFILLIKKSPLVVSVNTGTIHLAAAVNTPVIVLYALTNPQHLPWKSQGKVLPFDVPPEKRSKNEVIRFVNQTVFSETAPMIEPGEIINSVYEIISGQHTAVFPELVTTEQAVANRF
ncbi:glycosyltransferase family 9 protein [Rubrolithibacter danxiaensis]|uniref:glycosyltransferase family 9 protein n=1 Tax=Rubrolithibacter danxiaensis TaxID=3390805 RepID=UPI003BF7F82C